MVRSEVINLGPDSHPFSIALHGPHIYWSDWSKKTLMRVDKDTGANNGTVGPADFARLNGLYSYSSRDHAACELSTVCQLVHKWRLCRKSYSPWEHCQGVRPKYKGW